MRHRIVVALACVACAVPAAAQSASPAASPGVDFLPRTLFFMSAEHLSGDDEGFVWDAHFAGELDFVDYGTGRVTFLADYQVILGEEFKAFDPNQGNYILQGAASARVPAAEVSGVFHHESRHLSDRLKRDPVDWNMVGVRVRHERTTAFGRFDARADVRGVIQKSFVDYSWEIVGRLGNRHYVTPRVAAVMDVGVRLLGVDGSQPRGRQTGFRAEGGLRFEGSAGAVELFLAGERRIDPYPLEFGTERWFTAGFRLLSR